MLDFLGLLYDGDGMLLEGDGPRTFTALQDVTMAFRAIVQAASGDPGGELRLGDRLWVIPPDLDPDAIGRRLVGLADLVRAGGRVGLASESAAMGQVAHDALLLVLREAEGRG